MLYDLPAAVLQDHPSSPPILADCVGMGGTAGHYLLLLLTCHLLVPVTARTIMTSLAGRETIHK